MSTEATTAGATAPPFAATASASTATECATASSGSATTSLGNATSGVTASQGQNDWYVESLRTYREDLTTRMTLQGQLLNRLLGRNAITRKQYDTIKEIPSLVMDRVEKLLDILETRRTCDIKTFFMALKEDEEEAGCVEVLEKKGFFQSIPNEDHFEPWPQSKAAYDMGPITVHINEQSVEEELEQVVTLASAIASSRVKGYIRLVNAQCQDIDAETFDKWKNDALFMLKQLIGENCDKLFQFSRNTAKDNAFYLHVVPASTPLLVPPIFTTLLAVVIPATKEELIEKMIKISPHWKCFVLKNDGKPIQLHHGQFRERMERIIKLMKVDKIAGFPDEEMKKYKRVETPNADYTVFTMYGADDGIQVKTGLQIWPEQYETLLGRDGKTQMKHKKKVETVIATLQHQYKKTEGLLYISPCIKIDDNKNRQEEPSGIICHIVVITSADMPLLLSITFEGQNLNEYSNSLLPYLDQMLSCTLNMCTFYVKHHVITKKTLENPNWLRDIIEEVQENKMNPESYLQIGEEKCKAMVYSLYTSFASFVPSTFASDRECTEYIQTMNLMTVEQLNTLRKCQADTAKVMLLRGLAGTGKTVVAVEYMKWIRSLGVNTDEVLYVTYSKVLEEHIRKIELPWCHTQAGEPLCQVTTISDMLTWEELPNKFKAVRWWILDDVQNYSSVEKRVTLSKKQDKDWPQDRDSPKVSDSFEEKMHHKTHGSMPTTTRAALAVMPRDTHITEENPSIAMQPLIKSQPAKTVKHPKSHIFNTSGLSDMWLTQVETLASQTNIEKMLLICDPTQTLGKGGQKELESIENIINFDTHLALKQISRNSIEISKFIKELIPSNVLKDSGYNGLEIEDMVAHKYKGTEPEKNVNCSYDFDALEDMMNGLQHKLLNTGVSEDDVGIIIDKSAVTTETIASGLINSDAKMEWSPLDDFVGIEKPYIIAVLGSNAHWCQKVALASRARVGLYWTELKKQVSSDELKQLFESRNNSYIAWVTSGKTAITVFGGRRYDTNRPLERVIAAPITPQGLGGQFEEVAEIPPVPHPRRLTAVVRYRDQVWLIGGTDAGNKPLSGCDVLDLGNWQWRIGPPMRTPRCVHTATVVAGEVITVGGVNENNKFLSSTETLGEENYWRPGPDLPEKRFEHAACEFEGRIYISGGGDGAGTKLKSVMSWAAGETSWRQEPSLTTGRSYHTMVTTGGSLLVCGGRGEYSMEQYHSQSGIWSTLTTRLPERSKIRSSAMVHSGVLYLVGGRPSPITLRYDGVWHTDQEMPWEMLDTEACLIELPITR